MISFYVIVQNQCLVLLLVCWCYLGMQRRRTVAVCGAGDRYHSSGTKHEGTGLMGSVWPSLRMESVGFFCLICVCDWQHIYGYLVSKSN